jgi:hypothetical protein
MAKHWQETIFPQQCFRNNVSATMFPQQCFLVFTHSGKHGETLAGNNASATMFPQQCFRNNVSATMFPSLPRALGEDELSSEQPFLCASQVQTGYPSYPTFFFGY